MLEKMDLLLEQLKKIKTNASIWELLMHYKAHCDTLIKAMENMKIVVDTTYD